MDTSSAGIPGAPAHTPAPDPFEAFARRYMANFPIALGDGGIDDHALLLEHRNNRIKTLDKQALEHALGTEDLTERLDEAHAETDQLCGAIADMRANYEERCEQVTALRAAYAVAQDYVFELEEEVRQLQAVIADQEDRNPRVPDLAKGGPINGGTMHFIAEQADEMFMPRERSKPLTWIEGIDSATDTEAATARLFADVRNAVAPDDSTEVDTEDGAPEGHFETVFDVTTDDPKPGDQVLIGYPHDGMVCTVRYLFMHAGWQYIAWEDGTTTDENAHIEGVIRWVTG